MKRESKYFLISFIIHIVFIGIFFIFSLRVSSDKKYFTIINKGAAFSVHVVSSPNEKIYTDEELINKQIVGKHKLKYPVKENAELAIDNKKKKKETLNKEKLNTGTSGTDGKDTKIVPLVKNTNIINFVPPIYPKSCLALGQEGTVIVRVLVSDEGKIIDNKLYKSSGYKLLDNAVIKAVDLWTVNTPPLKTSWVEVIVNFIIK